MTLIRYKNRFPNFLENFFNDGFEDWNRNNFSNENSTLPSVNIKENKDNFMVEVAAPGFEKSDFNIEVENNMLCISSDKQESNETTEDEKVTKREFSYQSFKRSFSLPETVNEDDISAKYDNGILCITIPKTEEKEKAVKQIEIS